MFSRLTFYWGHCIFQFRVLICIGASRASLTFSFDYQGNNLWLKKEFTRHGITRAIEFYQSRLPLRATPILICHYQISNLSLTHQRRTLLTALLNQETRICKIRAWKIHKILVRGVHDILGCGKAQSIITLGFWSEQEHRSGFSDNWYKPEYRLCDYGYDFIKIHAIHDHVYP